MSRQKVVFNCQNEYLNSFWPPESTVGIESTIFSFNHGKAEIDPPIAYAGGLPQDRMDNIG